MAPPAPPRRARLGRRLACVAAAGAVVAAFGVDGGPAGAAGRALGAGAGVPAARPAPGGPATPLLSVRRVPGWVERDVAADRLAGALAPAVDAIGAAAGAHSCLVVTQGSATLLADHPALEVLPASNMKLLTATAVFDEAGTTERLITSVTTTAATAGGVVDGDVYLVGGGDPFLWTASYDAEQVPPEPMYTSLAALAAEVKKAGIREVRGSVLGDQSMFDTERGVPGWSPSYESDQDVGPLSALEVDNGFRQTRPYGPAPQPATMAAQVFTGLLKAEGVKVTGRPGQGVSPAGATAIMDVESAPMAQIVDAVLEVSDDTGAELLTKLLGKWYGAGGTTAAGLAVIRSDLADDGLPVGQVVARDGSGLDRGDRVTCGLIADALRRAGPGGPLFRGLPVAGRTGTLADRMVATAAAGRLHAKTGTLDGVAALSGFVMPAPATARSNPELAQPLVFSLIMNDVAGDVGFDVGNLVGEALAAFPDVPPLSAAGPRSPARPAG